MFLHHFIHIPWTQPDSWRVLPRRIREEIFDGILSNDIIGFHTRSYRWNFLQCCRDLMGLEVDFDKGVVIARDGRPVWVRAYPLPIDWRATKRIAASEETERYEGELLQRRREFLIVRVDRADLSKNVLRGFAAFDLFLEQHPEFRERVTFLAQLIPSRTDVPEYAEYLEKIEALVAVVNHHHGTPDWMPIQLKLRDNLEEAMAAFKHYDVLLVNAMFDGMNLVAKEGPLVNTRSGVSILSENTGAHEVLGEHAISVNPFDIQELADAFHRALTMSPFERDVRWKGLERIVHSTDPGEWIDAQLADIERKSSGTPPEWVAVVAAAPVPGSSGARRGRRAGVSGRGVKPVNTTESDVACWRAGFWHRKRRRRTGTPRRDAGHEPPAPLGAERPPTRTLDQPEPRHRRKPPTGRPRRAGGARARLPSHDQRPHDRTKIRRRMA